MVTPFCWCRLLSLLLSDDELGDAVDDPDGQGVSAAATMLILLKYGLDNTKEPAYPCAMNN